jgi:hypothetical protein
MSFLPSDGKMTEMLNPNLNPLDYITPKRKAEKGILPLWLPFVLLISQFIWWLPAMFWSRDMLMDGLSKRPLFDLWVYAMTVAPSIAAFSVGLRQCRSIYRQESSLKHCGVTIIAMLLAAAIIAMTIYGWVDDDLVNRSTPHGLW